MIFNPTGFAVIGASRESGKVGHAVFKNLLESKIKAFPVNPNAKKVLGVKCFNSVTKLKGRVSHAVIAVPAKVVPQVIKECGEAGVKVAIIISAGFSEAGNKGLEKEVISIAQEKNVKLIGPNVLGVIIPDSYNASFFKGELNNSGISFISQSGALGVGVLDLFASNDWGLRAFISVGNMAHITITDILKELLDDEGTKCVMIYAESLKQGREFMKTCQHSNKPVFVLKAGITEAGKKASATHTGSLAGSDVIYSAAFKQCGAIRVNSLNSLMTSSLIYDKYGFIGDKALVITNAGGPGILLTDELGINDFRLPSLPRRLISELNKELKGVAWSKNNPIDLVGDAKADRYTKALKLVKNRRFYDFAIILLTPQAMTQPIKTAKQVVKFAKQVKKPVFSCFIGGEQVNEANDLMSEELITFNQISNLVNALSFIKG